MRPQWWQSAARWGEFHTPHGDRSRVPPPSHTHTYMRPMPTCSSAMHHIIHLFWFLQDGSNLHSAGSMPVSNVRLLRPLPGGREGLLCITGDGLMLALNADASTVMDSCTLPGTPAEAASAAPATPTPSDGAAASDEQQQAGVNGQATAAAGHDGAAAREEALSNATSAAVGPEFLEAAGYRGHRQARASSPAVLCMLGILAAAAHSSS